MVPEPLKRATAAGIGLFIAFIGLKNAGIIVDDPGTLDDGSHIPGEVVNVAESARAAGELGSPARVGAPMPIASVFPDGLSHGMVGTS